MKLDPYDVLGVSHKASYNDVKRAYKIMLHKTHPDKMGDASCFMLVHKAFAEIQKQLKFKETDAPKQKTSYTNNLDVAKPTKMKNFTQEKFNKYFDQHRIDTVDPYATEGYSAYMCERLKHQEDISQASKNKVHIPTTKIVRYKEPDVLPSSSLIDSAYHFGVDSVNDFSGAGGTDIMKAFSHTSGEPIDTVKRYRNVDELLNARSSQNMEQTEKEKRRQQRREAKLHKLEQYRLQCMRTNDADVSNAYVSLHNRLR